MKKISYCFLFMLVFSVYAEKKKLPVISKWEWCQGFYDESKEFRGVFGGGSWFSYTNNLRVATRYYGDPSDTYDGNGFRCVSGFPAAKQ
jgi:hypothetical protein